MKTPKTERLSTLDTQESPTNCILYSHLMQNLNSSYAIALSDYASDISNKLVSIYIIFTKTRDADIYNKFLH